MNEEWLSFIVDCKTGKRHDYDIVEVPMADDTILNYVEDYIRKDISRVAFWELENLDIQHIKLFSVLKEH